MTRMARVLGAAAVLAAAPLAAQQRAAFAVLPFENGGSYGQDKEIFEALELGVPAMIARALEHHPGAQVAERRRVNQALGSLGLGVGQRVDAATAAQVAKAAGARYVVTGSYSDFYGKFRINARVVDGQTGEILKVVGNDDPKLQDRAQLSAIVQHVSEKVAAAAGLRGDAGSAPAAVPTEAISDFSRGLLHESRGDRVKALEYFQRAATAAPGFEEARDGVQRVRGG
jgi:TolB-like protein